MKSISNKKKAAEEDGVPEDEEGEESEGSIVEDEDEEGEEDIGEDAGEVEIKIKINVKTCGGR